MRTHSSPKLKTQISFPLKLATLALIPVQALTATPVYLLAAAPSLVTAESKSSGVAKMIAAVDPTLGVKVNRTVPDVATPTGLSFSDAPSDSEISSVRVFAERLVPIGRTDSAENKALAAAITAFAHAANPEETDLLTQHLEHFPQSPWRASLLANLGAIYYSTGYWSKALDAWDGSWKLIGNQTEPQAKALGDYAVGELAKMNARLGRFDRLQTLFAQVDGRDVRGPAAEKLAGARQGLALMQAHPENAFRCGPMALEKILLASSKGPRFDKEIFTSRSTQQGMSLLQVNQLAAKLGLKYQMAKRSPGAQVIYPSVVNWKVGHFAAITKVANGKFLSQDPTFTDDVWVTADALDEESSGYYLVPAGRLPEGWKSVSAAEGRKVWGKGNAGSNSEPTPPDNTPKVKDCGENQGMAGYNIDAARISLMIGDTPLGYTPPKGPAVKFSVSYQQREVAPVQTPTYSNLGNLWSFNWLSYLIVDPANDAADAKIYGPSGGTLRFTGYNTATQRYAPQMQTQVILVKTGTNLYEKRFPDGSKQIFSLSDGAAVYPRNIFMTQSVDAHGNALTYTYDASFRIVAVTDALGQVTTLTYGLSGDPLKITKVTDPFGRYTTLEYNGASQLWKITDTVGLVSQFAYGPSDFIKTLTTPYGTTSFYASTGMGASYRWIEVADPQGARERVEFNDAVGSIPYSDPANTLPAGMNTFNSFLSSRNTFFWDKKAMEEAPYDYTKARITHWLHTQDINVASDVPESTKLPLERRVWMGYPGYNGLQTGTSSKPSQIGRVLDDGTTQLYQYEYNDSGNVTKATDPAGRSTTYTYDTNGIDLLEVRQTTGGTINELLASYTYNGQHLPLTATDASGQTTTYTYYPSGQIHTVTNAKSEVTTFNYDTNGYLQNVVGAIPGATTSFTYDGFGRMRTVADSEGYSVTTDYDAIGGDPLKTLNRPAKVTYPDGTYEQLTYNRLDPEWIRDRMGRWTRKFYDSLRHLIAVEDPLYRLTKYDWCGCGSLGSITDPNGNLTSWTRDIQGRVSDKVYPDQTVTHYTYEGTTSRVASILDAKNQSTNYAYFVDNNLQQVSYTNAQIVTPSVTYTYDPAYNRIATMTDGTGLTTYSYNPIVTPTALGAGRLTSVDGPLDNDTITYSYDELGRTTGRSINGSANASALQFDSLGRMQSATNPLGTFNYAYVNATGRIDHVDFPNGQKTQFTYFDNIGGQRLKQIKNLDPISAVISQFDYTYNPIGNIATWTQANSGQANPRRYDFGYDAANQLRGAALTDTVTQASVSQYEYDYDAAANRTSDQLGSVVSTYAPNNLNQIMSRSGGGKMHFRGTVNEPSAVTVGGTPATVDGAGNFNGTANVSTGTNTVAVVAIDANGNTRTNNYQVTASGAPATFTYDLNGNLINDGSKTYEWDAANRLTAINYVGTNNRSEFTYDGLSRRIGIVEKTGGSVTSTKNLVWCRGKLCEERDAANNVTKRFYGQGEQLGTSNYYYTRDHIGSICELSDSGGNIHARYSYDPYGVRIKLSGDVDSSFGYTGHYFHQSSGLNLALYRAYDSMTGRWISRDPVREAGGLNLQSYVFNNPVNLVDPSGLTAALALNVFGRYLVRAGVVEAAGLGPENPVADLLATGILLYGIYDAIKALNQNEADKPQEKSCPNDSGATNPNTPDPNDPGGDLRQVPNNQLKNDGIDAHALKEDFLGNQGGRYNISVDGEGNVQLTPVRPGAAPNVNTGLNYNQLAELYPL